MNQKTRMRFALLVLILLILWILVWVKMFVLPIFTNPFAETGDHSNFALIFGGGVLIMGLVIMALMHQRKKTTTAHGSAHFATREELKTASHQYGSYHRGKTAPL
jgi:LPXTG-motif cell wall-anchored protein